MEQEKIRVIRKLDGQSMDYETGDIFTVDSRWYGGVNVTSKLGIPLSLSREEYEPYEEKKREIDVYSYELGAMDCFCEMTGAGVKRLAMSHPCDTREERDSYLEEVRELCRRYGVLYYQEDEAFITDLFPEEANRGKFNYLFFKTEEVLKEYLELKERQREMKAQGVYTAAARYETAEAFGRMLSYSEEGIRELIRKAAVMDSREV